MLIKQADDQSKRLDLLESLQDAPTLDSEQRKWLKIQISNLRKGMSGERDAAYYIDHYYKDNPNLAVLHDLRLEFDGDVAQIDHLLISRGLFFYLLETKNFGGNLSINEHGEFTVHYGSNVQGIPSPLEQSRRHEKVLSKWLERLEITGRLGGKPQVVHVVLVAPKSTIRRPDPSKFDTSNVIKADQFDAWRTERVEKGISLAQTLTGIVNLRSSDTLREWAEKLARQHRPQKPQDWLPDFMRPRTPQQTPAAAPVATPPIASAVCAICSKPVSAEVVTYCHHHVDRFGGAVYCREHQTSFQPAAPKPESSKVAAPLEPMQNAVAEPPRRQLICADCGCKISYAEGKFCWNNEKRFGGLQYCRTHQADHP